MKREKHSLRLVYGHSRDDYMSSTGEGADESHANPSLDDEKFMSRDSSILCDSHNTEEIEGKHENYAEILLLGGGIINFQCYSLSYVQNTKS